MDEKSVTCKHRLNYYQFLMHLFLSFDFTNKECKPDDIYMSWINLRSRFYLLIFIDKEFLIFDLFHIIQNLIDIVSKSWIFI